MYKILFQESGLTNKEICKRLNIQYNERVQYEKTNNINVDKFVMFTKKLGVDPKKMAMIIHNEIIAKYKG